MPSVCLRTEAVCRRPTDEHDLQFRPIPVRPAPTAHTIPLVIQGRWVWLSLWRHLVRAGLPEPHEYVCSSPVGCARRSFERAGELRGDPASVEVTVLRLHALIVEPGGVDPARIEGEVVSEFFVAG